MSDKEVKALEGSIDFDYKWNPGTTVGRFLTSLRDEQELIAVRCTKTSKVFLPPQKWSPYGNIVMNRFVPVKTAPKLKAGTIVYTDIWNKPEGVKTPYMTAAIRFEGADTELIHLVCGSEEELKSLKPGDELKPVWKSEPQGNIRDLEYFEKA